MSEQKTLVGLMDDLVASMAKAYPGEEVFTSSRRNYEAMKDFLEREKIRCDRLITHTGRLLLLDEEEGTSNVDDGNAKLALKGWARVNHFLEALGSYLWHGRRML